MSSSDFTIPAKPDDLTSSGCTYDIRVENLKDLSDSDAKAFAQGVVYELCSDSSVGILQQKTFDNVYSLVRGIVHLDTMTRMRLIDSLCSNLSVLGVSAMGTIALEDEEDRDDTAFCHASALKAYTFLLWWILTQCEEEDRKAQPTVSTGGGAARGGKKKKAGDIGTQWDWDSQREKILRCMASCAEIDLWKLFRPKSPDSRLLEKWMQMAALVLESHQAMKSKPTKTAAFLVLATVVHKYQQLDTVTGALVDILNKHEHAAPVLAELAEYANASFKDPRLGVEILREVALVDPLEYDQQQKDDAAGIRNVSTFVQELAERMPKAVAQHMSVLMTHLGGKAHPLRSAITTVIGILIQTAYADAPEEAADAQGTMARLRSKQHLLDTLIERARDQSAFTRARVLQTWSSLAVSRSIDMGHWLTVTEIAIGRLEDKSPYVRKNALLLLSSLLSFNPFAPHLPEDKFVATLEEYKRKLEELDPARSPAAANLDTISEEVKIDPDAEAEQAHAEQQDQADDATDVEMQTTEESNGNTLGTGESAQEEGQPPSEEVARLRTTVACMDAAVGFIKAVQGGLTTVCQLLASSNLSDVTESIALLITYDKFCIKGAKQTLKQMLPLIFTREPGVKEAVLGAIDELCIGDLTPEEAAKRLMELLQGSTLGELSSLEEVIAQMLVHQPPLLTSPVIEAVWQTLVTPQPLLGSKSEDWECACSLISMIAPKQPETVAKNLDLLLKVAFGSLQKNSSVIRSACTALQKLDASVLRPEEQTLITSRLVSVVLDRQMPVSGWFSAAEAAIKAIFALHPAPGAVGCAALRASAASVYDGRSSSNNRLARFFFAVGQVALQLLVHIEQIASATRRQRLAKEKAAAENQSQVPPGNKDGKEDDIAAQVGAGSVSADLELDSLKDAADAQILHATNLIGQYGKIVTAFCYNRAMMAADYTLRTSALLALTKLMALDAHFCDRNLQFVFTILQNHSVEAPIRSNLVVAIGDLAFRFPNVLEPWTPHIYQPLADPDKGAVKNSLMVLTHLILNDMMKVKGHVAQLALCLQDTNHRVASLAQLFFHELSQKAYKGTTPVYNLLPDILSNLSSERGLSQRSFQEIMRHLLQYIGKEKHADSLVDKLCARFVATPEIVQWRNLAFCIGQLNFSEKGYRRLMELISLYQCALRDDEVLDTFKNIAAKGKKLAKPQPEFRSDLEAFEQKLVEVAATCKAEWETEQAAKRSGQEGEQDANDIEIEVALEDDSPKMGSTPAEVDRTSQADSINPMTERVSDKADAPANSVSELASEHNTGEASLDESMVDKSADSEYDSAQESEAGDLQSDPPNSAQGAESGSEAAAAVRSKRAAVVVKKEKRSVNQTGLVKQGDLTNAAAQNESNLSQHFASMDLREAQDQSPEPEVQSASHHSRPRSQSLNANAALQGDSRRNSAVSSVYGTPNASEASATKSGNQSSSSKARAGSVSSHRINDGFGDENNPTKAAAPVRRRVRPAIKTESA